MAKPRVTAIIDTYNHERFVEEAIVSVLEQDFSRSETEVIVVDDGLTDRTPEIVRKFEPRLRLIRKPNGGRSVSPEPCPGVEFHEAGGTLSRLKLLAGEGRLD